MSEIDVKTHLVNNPSLPNTGKVVVIQRQPIMECALDILPIISGPGRVTLSAKGDDIPTAVGVANVITENMMKGNAEIVDIIVDSENGPGQYGMTLISTIQIIIARKLN